MDHSEAKLQTAIWDFPVRMFHGLLIVLMAMQFLTGQFEWLSMRWHFWLGYATLTLVLFRIFWGFFGSETALFKSFIHRPGVILEYVRSLFHKNKKRFYSHNPLGGLAVIAMLGCVLFQAVSGLFSADDIGEAGPFADFVSEQTVRWMSRLHRLNRNLLIGLIALHIAAVLFYLIVLRQNLTTPMITGRTPHHSGPPPRFATLWRALWVFGLSAFIVFIAVLVGTWS